MELGLAGPAFVVSRRGRGPRCSARPYDAQLRAHVHDPLARFDSFRARRAVAPHAGFGGRGLVLYRDLDGLEGAELDELIARQVHISPSAASRRVEAARARSPGRPSGPTARSGLCARRHGDGSDRARRRDRDRPAALPDGVVLREVSEPRDLGRIAADGGGGLGRRPRLVENLSVRSGSRPRRAQDLHRRAGRRRVRGLDAVSFRDRFATLWGGETLPAWRGWGPTARSSPTGRGSPQSAAAAISRSTPPTTAGLFSNGSGSSR